jgi:CDP-diacylglycerol---serine O-phosphatidyltransferase
VDARYFVGLPIPAGAAQVAAIAFVFPRPVDDRWVSIGMLALVVALAFLMVSTFRYRSFKGVDLRRRRSYISVLGIALLFLLVAVHPEASLLAATSLYTVSGPLAWAVSAFRRRGEPAARSTADQPQPVP